MSMAGAFCSRLAWPNAQADTQVETRNERVERSRRTILEMLNASVNLEQAPEIQDMMTDYSADERALP